ncbi:phage terminase large subunit family protein [Oceanibacterium hippocampi]|uniref:Phage terminase large subunit (GpA) n=1 Tax=Oceanibacterium hippocampi TaxID=745714 RepID=A0A1Y5U4W6_9PROT|nr:terminase gpA endonuclease subunit [Oceanibacterium hippocampi]SLN77287.1 Phage terminase large subunit (GpA) [Oceanibacterium hippocampi]
MASRHLTRDQLPAFVDHRQVIRRALEAARPPRRVTVSECAERHRHLNKPGSYVGPWRNEMSPYLAEIMDRTESRRITILVVVGPSQFGKTEIHINLVGHAIKYRRRDMLLIRPSKKLADDFAERRLEQDLFRHSPDFAAELGESDKALTKVFRNGAMLTIGWPTAGELADRPVPIVMLDERDRIKDDIGGEGDPIALARNRIRSFDRDGLILATSSPSRTDHSGIMPLFEDGDRNLWFWPCAHCGEFWSPGFDLDRQPTTDQLRWPEGADPEEARENAWLVCPHCGGIVLEHEKRAMNLRGVWIPDGMAVTPDGALTGTAPGGRIASYWFSGLASNFNRLGDLAADLITARRYHRQTGDDSKLKTVLNTGFGIPYVPKAGSRQVDSHAVRSRVEGYRMGELPEGVLYLTAAIDCQAWGWPVLVKGWGRDGESWNIDRFQVRQLADGRTDCDPAAHPEHWDELLGRVIRRRYPFAADNARGLAIANTALDTGGLDGVTVNARRFWIRCRRAGVADGALTLVKGANTRSAPLLARPTVEANDRGRRIQGGSKIYLVGVHALKKTVVDRLRRKAPGPGYIHQPEDMPAYYFEEVAGERLGDKGAWEKVGVNDSLDLEVYNLAAALRIRPERIDWRLPPRFAMPVPIADADGSPAPAGPPATDDTFEEPAADDVEILDLSGQAPAPRPRRPRPAPFVKRF